MTITFGIVARIQCFIEFSICLEDIPICLRRKAVEAMRFVDNEQIKFCVPFSDNFWNVKR